MTTFNGQPSPVCNLHEIRYSCQSELKKAGSTGSTLPEHQRQSPGTHKARHYLKDVWIAFQAICSAKIAQFINISLIVPVA